MPREFFCNLPFSEIFTDGKFASPCCVFQSNQKMLLAGYHNNQELLSVKKSMLQGIAPAQCSYCVQQEKQSGKSFRTLANDFNPNLCIDIKQHGTTYHKIRTLLINTSNVCNLKCLPCEHGSFVRSKELYDLKLITIKPKVHVSPNFVSELDFSPETINFTGGEPFYDDTWQFIDAFTKKHKTKEIAISINTNLTLIDVDKLKFLIDNFKTVTIKGSVDGVGSVNDYLRYPSKWEIIEQNIDYILHHSMIGFVLTTALSNLALLRYHDLLNWALAKGIEYLFISQVSTPPILACTNFFQEHCPNLLEKFITLKSNPHLKPQTADCIDMCINICQNNNSNHVSRATLKQYLELHDAKRHTSWTNVFPELNLGD